MARTSLKRIQALEKDYSGLSEQLVAVSEIIDDSLDFLKRDPKIDLDEEIPCPLFAGKIDWALKWALNKLEIKDPAATSARSCPEIWYLVGNLIPRASVNCLTSSLNGNRLTPLLGLTLEENFNRIQPSQTLKQSAETELSNNVDHSHSAKRRKIDPLGFVDSSIRPDSTANQLHLFDALSRCLAQVQLISNDLSKQRRVTTEFPSTRTGAEQASKILGHWLAAVNLYLTPEVYEHDIQNIDSRNLYLSLQFVLSTWYKRIIDLNQADLEGPTYFSNYCLLQSVASLNLIDPLRSSVEKAATPMSDYLKDAIKLIETLPAKEFILPIQAKFKDQNKNKNSAIEQFFEPLRIQFTKDESKPLNGVPSVSSLFKVAMKVTPLTSPTKRVAEKPWIETLFLNLCDCLGVNFEELNDKFISPLIQHELELMVQTLKNFQMTISRNPLEIICWNCLNNTAIDDSRRYWSFFRSVVTVDPHVFSAGNIKRDGSRDEPSQYLIDKLVSTMSKSQWSRKEASAKRNERYMDFIDIISDLVRAFTSDRKLDWFLRVWDSQTRATTKKYLEKFYEAAEQPSRTSIWEDPEPISVLSGALHMYSPQSWKTFLDQYLVIFETISHSKFNPVEQVHLFALTSFLKVLILATQQEQILRILRGNLARVVLICTQALQHHKSFPDTYLSYLYELIAVAHHRLARVVQDKEFPETGLGVLKTLSSIAVEKVEKLLNTCSDIQTTSFSDLIRCIGSIVEDAGNSSTLQPDTSEIIRPLFNSMSKALDKSNNSLQFSQKEGILSAVATHPKLLGALSTDDKSDTTIHHFLKATFRSGLLGNATFEKFSSAILPPGMLIVEAAIQGDGELLTSLNDLIAEVVDSLLNEISLKEADFTHLRQVMNLYNSIPPAEIPRKHREKVLDLISGELTSGKTIKDEKGLVYAISFMLDMLQEPCGNSQLVSNASTLINTITFIETTITQMDLANASEELFGLGRRLIEAAIQQNTEDISAPRSITFFRDALGFVGTLASQRPLTIGNAALSAEAVCLFVQALRLYFPTLERMDASVETLDSLYRENIFTNLQQLASSELELTEIRQRCIFHEIKVAIELITTDMSKWNGPKRNEFQKNLLSFLHSHPMKESTLDVRRQAFRVETLWFASQRRPPHNASIIKHLMAESNEREAMQTAKLCAHDISKGSMEDQAAMMAGLCSSIYIPGQQQHQRLAALYLLKSILEQYSDENSNTTPTVELKKATHALLHSIASSDNDIKCFHYSTDGLRLLLNSNLRTVDQSVSEMILFTTSQICSSYGPCIDTKHAKRVFTQLCLIMQLVLIRHRHHLRGRFDSLASTLQDLLRCFFSSPVTRTSGITDNPKIKAMPPWLASNGKSLAIAEAKQFTRLITLICSPSVSAVATAAAKRKKQLVLTDETAKARAYAARYMHLVLLEFVNCTLAGRALVVEVRRELMRGMFAILEITSEDILAAVNSRLTPLARSVLAGIVSEWKRLGRAWQED